MTDRQLPDDLEVMAAGLALGLLGERARAEALRHQLENPGFAERVYAWQKTAGSWLEDVEPIEAPANALSSIEALLDRRAMGTTPAQPIANDRHSVKLWRTWAITATAASLALAVGLGVALFSANQEPDQDDAPIAELARPSANVAQIKDAEGVPLLSALYDPGSGSLSLRLADLQQPEFGPELWVIPEDGTPRSLGLIDSERLTVILSPELRSFLRDGATMAITIEPRDSAPHDAPTGEILGTATLQEVPGNTI
ncbi:anti-sigma factor [Qipengyuania qiaonensis]|uniref:Anti-sigma factor n=1 Tax=Qipengyuania qiaonensis TaxID=2867240 RepID=A0ABS7JBM2_9SPHN|nr:anti-sigma factor [Qipengyuania qiaonensis]MBX7483454.1 anti-sigma factor [Qipengyuania qiaonensis]